MCSLIIEAKNKGKEIRIELEGLSYETVSYLYSGSLYECCKIVGLKAPLRKKRKSKFLKK